MLSAVIIAQTAIFLKKKFENRRDRIAVGNIEYDEEKNNHTNCMNTQKWNPNICATPTTFFIILVVFVVHFISGTSLLKWFNLNSNEKSLLATNVYQLMFNLGVPLYMYGKNISIFQHLIHDLLEEFLGIENIPTCFPKRTSMIYRSNQKLKISQKLQSKSEPLAHCYPEGERNVYGHFLKTVLENLKIFTDLLSKFPFLHYKNQRKIQA